MTPEQQQQLAALRDRLNSDMRGVAFNQTSHTFNVTIADVCFLLDLLADAERQYRELWCAVWCCPPEEFRDDHDSAKQEVIRQAMIEAGYIRKVNTLTAELATATERAERAADAIDRDALVSWLVSKDRKPPEAAFTTGSNRFVADLVVIAESYATQKAADARQAEIVAMLRKPQADAEQAGERPALWHDCYAAAADAIEAGEHRAKGGGDG